MPLRLYNTASRSVEAFAPVEPGHVRIYVCGLTPSAEAHLGHARSFMFFDVLRRHLVRSGYRVTFVQNVTDIDDRSIATAAQLGCSWRDVIDKHFGAFKASMRKLGVLEPDHEPRATEFVPEIVAMIAELMARGYAYAAADGVYYRVKQFDRYGALSHRNVDELMVGARIGPGEDKADPLDFALWKFAKPGEPQWPSPWGAGRPGWHIECSAMAHTLLGEPFDIHGGGFDLVFPHHENEVAQSEPLLERPPMVRFWVHGGLLAFDGKKMSKSLGNFEPLESMLQRYDPQAIRLLFLGTGYRKPMNFTEASIAGATAGLGRLLDAYDALREAPAEPAGGSAAVESLRERFWAALDDDVNTSGAVSVLFDAARDAGALRDDGASAAAAAFLHESMETL
ncbi:MAG: cysteine--tRNA ligase, partial [Candidatus Eremiobacteraeota bacterium]|nr:cysteine--tRNA ligase [Candidatus Eremiobacteraeota bacterium]